MSLSNEQKQEVITSYKINDNDTGSASVQVALLTTRIKGLTKHFKTHKKDRHSRIGLLRLVNRRKKLLSYLKGNNVNLYVELISKLGLRK